MKDIIQLPIQVLKNEGESLNFEISCLGVDSVRLILTLNTPHINLGGKEGVEPFKTMAEGYEKARALLSKPILFEGSTQTVSSEFETFFLGSEGEEILKGKVALKGYADTINGLLKEAEQKIKESKKITPKKSAVTKKKSNTKKVVRKEEEPSSPPPEPELNLFDH